MAVGGAAAPGAEAAARDGGEEPEAPEETWPSLQAAAVDILRTPCPFEKARRTDTAKRLWKAGGLPVVADGDVEVPDAPARPSDVGVVSKGKVKSGSMKAMLHGVCHAESYAIDLMWDSVARFARGDDELRAPPPREFFDEWVDIAHDESRHFRSWARHLEEKYVTRYGDLPTHDMLWDVAFATRHSLAARLAVVHLIHEARGMDVAPTMRAKCLRSQDPGAVAILDANIADEVGHVRAGARWFKRLCLGEGAREPVDAREEFLRLARAHYTGGLKRPLNTELREQAEIPEEWYLPLVETDDIEDFVKAGGERSQWRPSAQQPST